MKNTTRKQFSAYAAHIASLNGVDDATVKFAVEPSIEQKMEDRIQESADFLKGINIIPVDEMTGEKIGLGIDSPIASRTDTTSKDRAPRPVGDMTGQTYEAKKTDFDTYITYKQMDIWAKFPDFQQRLRNKVIEQIARDRLMIGFNGTSAAVETDIATNQLLQDVNIGWLQHIRNDASERVLDGIKVGAGGDYENMDAAVFDAVNELIDPWHRDDSELVAITGRSLLSDKYLGLINANDKPTEKNALRTLMANKTLGNLPGMGVPFFPTRGLLITKMSNLSIYWQSGSRRRYIQDNPKRDRVEDFNSVNEAYVVEDFGACALLDNILLPDGAGGWV
ncbi:phage major capsid protein, P2 family [Thalassospira sp.]|jgi:P2 family phage major capsid protein|uniref:phage major capsid protein, P2 family n=1 Tax=Thalassospira sp. TaxID=1912094 RepID=UPI001B0EBF51|nr:phage major capsid protein, P2 family [Thalassospira sp.]MBO6805741.1 phage major capsid protein, P2 family [Thalassospira sp.]MBO6841355.1 phage major capsid protein, P2 family [Thalassospira sp.]